MTQGEFAQTTGISAKTIISWRRQNDPEKPFINSLKKICEVGGHNPHWLKTGEGEKRLPTPPAVDNHSTIKQHARQGFIVQNSTATINATEQQRQPDQPPPHPQIHTTVESIRSWLEELEATTPGHCAWFTFELQNRFPEYKQWLQHKQTGQH